MPSHAEKNQTEIKNYYRIIDPEERLSENEKAEEESKVLANMPACFPAALRYVMTRFGFTQEASPVRCPRRMQSSVSSQKTPKYKKLSRKRKTAQNLSILSCFMMECRWWDSNPHGFPNDFESFASAIPPHRLIFNFGTLVPVSEDWRDVQEGCKKSCFDKLSKFNEYS